MTEQLCVRSWCRLLMSLRWQGVGVMTRFDIMHGEDMRLFGCGCLVAQALAGFDVSAGWACMCGKGL